MIKVCLPAPTARCKLVSTLQACVAAVSEGDSGGQGELRLCPEGTGEPRQCRAGEGPSRFTFVKAPLAARCRVD